MVIQPPRQFTTWQYWTSVRDLNEFVFSVKVHQDARVILSGIMGNAHYQAYGVYVSTKIEERVVTRIFRESIMEESVEVPTGLLLSGNRFTTLWIRWHATEFYSGTRICVGRGAASGRNVIACLDSRASFKIVGAMIACYSWDAVYQLFPYDRKYHL